VPAGKSGTALFLDTKENFLRQVARSPASRKALAVAIELSCYVNRRDGVAFPKQETLAANIGKCTKTVQRALDELEKLGFIERTRRNTRSVNRYRIRPNLDDSSKSSNDASEEVMAGVPLGATPAVLSERTTAVRSETTTAVLSKNPVIEPKNPTLSAQTEGDDVDLKFKDLKTAYRCSAATNFGEARRLFARLSDADRDLAIEMAALCRDARVAFGRSYSKDLANWLRDEDFRHIQAQSPAKSTIPKWVFVKQGSPQWWAWLQHKNLRTHPSEYNSKVGDTGWSFPSEWPPGVAREAGGEQG
jgi:DNA-binding transcriptional regulator YhcF (GntR family)